MAPPYSPYVTNHRTSYCSAQRCFWCLYISFCTAFVAFFIFGTIITFYYQPKEITLSVEKASLSQFSLAVDNTTLRYNLTADISVRNPSKRVSVHYDRIEARALFQEKDLGSIVDLPTFYQPRKNTTTFHLAFNGQKRIDLDSKGLDEFYKQKSEGAFRIQVKINMKVRYDYKRWRIKTRPRADCKFRVPLGTNGSLEGGTPQTYCKVKFRGNDPLMVRPDA